MQIYTDPSRESAPHALPDAEVWYCDEWFMPRGWYWQSCFPGCLPDGEAIGPFETEDEAIFDAQDLGD